MKTAVGFAARVLTIWNAAGAGVYLFAACVAVTMALGGLDPVSFASYGVAASWRLPVLLTLFAVLQVLGIGDAIVLGRRLRSAAMWAILILAAIVGPFTMVVVLGQIDGWRYDHRSSLTNLGAGVAMVLVVAAIYALRRRAYRRWT